MKALTAERARQEEARRIYDETCNEAAAAEINCTTATVDVLGKAEALEKQLKTVTMRVDSLLITESDFLQRILEQHEEAQNHLNALFSTAEYGPAADHAPTAA